LLRNYTGGGYFSGAVNDRLKRDTFHGFDIKRANISLARINMCLVGDGHTNIQLTRDSLITLENEKYDYILANVPYGDYKGAAVTANFTYAKKKRYENLFLEKIVKGLKYGGKAVVIIPDGILESPSLNQYRVNFLNEVKVEAVISLHPYVFRPYTTEKTYAIIFQRRQKIDIAKALNYNIFMYILENDGFQKGDKRYPIRENNIPDLLLNYQTERCAAPHAIVNIKRLTDENFHNLTPEFYLNYYEVDYRDVDINEYKEMINKLKQLNKTLENPFGE
jgi:type I restriction-modification system DNA methylase subunit